MPRCLPHWSAAVLAAALALPAVVQAQVQRNFPQQALRGQMTVVQPPVITLNGQPAQLAPGARIRGFDNLLVMSGAIVGQPHVVNYTTDTQGAVMDVWLLRPEEARRPWPKSAQEAARMNFDPAAQAWTRR